MQEWLRRRYEQYEAERRAEQERLAARRLDELIHRSAPEPVEVRGTRRWRFVEEQWRPWLRRSVVGLELYTRYQEADEYRFLLGDEAYQEQLVRILSRSAPRDCAAAGLGCLRRSDRRCQEPEVCSQEPTTPAGDGSWRQGPVPGACSEFDSNFPDALGHICVMFSVDGRHRAVTLAEDFHARTVLWVDGRQVGEPFSNEPVVHWADNRFLVVLDGPSGPLLLHDAEQASTRSLRPGPGQVWTSPRVVRHGDVLHVYPSREAVASGAPPDRTLAVTPGEEP